MYLLEASSHARTVLLLQTSGDFSKVQVSPTLTFDVAGGSVGVGSVGVGSVGVGFVGVVGSVGVGLVGLGSVGVGLVCDGLF